MDNNENGTITKKDDAEKTPVPDPVEALFTREALAVLAGGGGNKHARSNPLEEGKTYTFTVPGNLIEVLDLAEIPDSDSVTMILFDDANISMNCLCRRGNGLRLKGITMTDMFKDFVSRAVDNGGIAKVKVTKITEQTVTPKNKDSFISKRVSFVWA